MAAATVLQVTVAPPINLVLVAIVASAARLGPRFGLALACAAGLVLDLGSAAPVCVHALALLPATYLAGRWPQWFSAVAGSLLYWAVLLAAYSPPIEALGARGGPSSAMVLLAFFLVRSLSLGRITRRAQA